MNKLNTLLVLSLVGLMFALSVSASIAATHEAKEKFAHFVKQYNKNYGSEEETSRRFSIFQNNLIRIDNYNTLNPTALFGINKFADLDENEFRALYKIQDFESHRGKHDDSAQELVVSFNGTLPIDFDWRNHSAVTPVKNQEQCGSCWAFSATEAIESAWFLAGNPLISLAPQQIVDCDVGNGDQGCDGGYTGKAFDYVIKAGGMETEAKYPYTAEDGTCQFKSANVVASIKGWAYVTKNSNETEMQVALVQQGPLSICVDATSWQFYIEGVVTSNEICENSLDHCVMITGFQAYEDWIWGTYNVWNVRNSWGADWGLDGYILVERGYDICGIADVATLPLVN